MEVKPIEEQLQETEAAALTKALQKCDGDRAAAARELGTNRSWVDRRVVQHGLQHLVKLSAGRPVIQRRCPYCKQKMTSREMFVHQGPCRRAHESKKQRVKA